MRIEIPASDKQREFLSSAAATVVFQGGARSGKTWAGALKALLNAQQFPCAGMIVAPSYPMLTRAVMPELMSIAGQMGLIDRWEFNRSDRIITLPGGGSIMLTTASDPGSLLGPTLGWAVGDEVALWPRLAYEYLQGRLSDTRGSRQVVFTFTPKGTAHWTYKTLGQARDGLEIIRATSRDNPMLPADYFERTDRELGTNSPIWRQEVLGEYVAFEGLVYPQFDPEVHVRAWPDGDDGEPMKSVTTIIGGDWGWTNPGVLLAMSMDATGAIWIRAETYERERSIEWWATDALRLRETLDAQTAFCDPSEPANIAAFQAAGVRAQRANNAVVPGITAVGARLTDGTLFVDPSCEHTISEFQAYCWKQTRDGTAKADEPEKVNDHAMDAARYGVMSFAQPRARVIQKPKGL